MSRSFGSTLGGLVAILLGLVGSIIGSDELRLALHSAPTPQQIRCADLCSIGPGKNAHVTLTDFTPLWEDASIIVMNEDGSLSQASVPVVPQGNKGRAEQARVLVLINGVHNSNELRDRLARGRLTGLIKARLQVCLDAAPGATSTGCWQLVEGATPSPLPVVAGIVAGAVFLAGLGLFLLVWGRDGEPGNQVQRHLLFMSPLLMIIDGLCGLFKGFAETSRKAAIQLGVIGGVLAGVGAYLWITDGLYSLEGFSFNLGLGAVLADIGLGLLFLAAYHAVRASRGSAAAVAEVASPEERRPGQNPIGIWLLGLGLGLLAGGGFGAVQKALAPSIAVAMIGAGVTAGLAGAYLLLVGRGERLTAEEEGVKNQKAAAS